MTPYSLVRFSGFSFGWRGCFFCFLVTLRGRRHSQACNDRLNPDATKQDDLAAKVDCLLLEPATMSLDTALDVWARLAMLGKVWSRSHSARHTTKNSESCSCNPAYTHTPTHPLTHLSGSSSLACSDVFVAGFFLARLAGFGVG